MNKIAALVFAAALIGCGATSSPSCRTDGQACAETTDCCSAFVCTIGRCTAGSTCSKAGETCGSTADCCSSLTCTGGKCVTAPTCGAPKPCTGGRSYQSCSTGKATYYKCSDGTIFTCASATNCTAAATAVVAWCNATGCRTVGQTCAGTSDCCNPLTCQGGTCRNAAMCRTQGQACAQTSDCCNPLVCYAGTCSVAGMTWTIKNLYGIRTWARFYTADCRLVWPDNVNAYPINNGQTGTYALDCTPGESVCYGAEDDGRSVYWGVDLDCGSSCNACCYPCDGKTHPVTLQ